MSVTNGGIPLQPWLWAPLMLSENSIVYTVLETYLTNNRFLEVITTATNPDYWGDIWRIEFDTDDAPGNSALLQNLLLDRGLSILNWESSVDILSQRHSTSVLVSGAGYDSDRDLTCRERMKARSPSLVELEEDITIYFWDQLAINADGSVRLKVLPMHFYRNLHDSVLARRRFILFRDGAPLRKGCIELSQRATDIVKRTFKTSDLDAFPTVDTKDRVIRTLITPKERPPLLEISVLHRGTELEPVRWLYNELFKRGANIIRAQLRSLSILPTDDPLLEREENSSPAGGNPAGPQNYFDNEWKQFDIAFEIVRADRHDHGPWLEALFEDFDFQHSAMDRPATIRRM